MRVAINVDGQFQPMTGIQHYVDRLIGALLATDTRHAITAFAPALFGSKLLDDAARDGGFAWRDHPRLRWDTAGNDEPFAATPLARLPFRRRLEQAHARHKYRSASRRAVQASRGYDLLHVPCPVPLRFEDYEARHSVATIYDLTPRLFPHAHDAGTNRRMGTPLPVRAGTLRARPHHLGVLEARYREAPLDRTGAHRRDTSCASCLCFSLRSLRAAVLSSNAASLPEVIGNAGVLVHPYDVEAMAAALTRMLTDRTENLRLRAAALAQAARFSWRKTAELTVRAYEAAAT